MEDKVALFDLDGTLASYEEQMAHDLKLLQSPGEPTFHPFEDVPDWFENRMDLIKSKPGWWKTLPKHPLGMDILGESQRIGFHIQILTKGPKNTTNAWTEKLEWCYDELDIANVTITSAKEPAHHKGLVYGRVLVDDYPDFVEAWLEWRKHGVVIMPANKLNENYEHPNVVRYDGSNIEEVRERLQWAFDRK